MANINDPNDYVPDTSKNNDNYYKVEVSGTNRDDGEEPKGGLEQASDGPWASPAAKAIQQAANAGRAVADPGAAADSIYHYVGDGVMGLRTSMPLLTQDQIKDIYDLQRGRLRSADQLEADKQERRGALAQVQSDLRNPVNFSPLQAALMGYAQSMGGRFIGVGGAMGDAAAAGYGQQQALAQAEHDNAVKASSLGLEFLQNEDKTANARDKDALDNLTKDIGFQQRMAMARAANNNGILNTPQGVVNTNYQDINGVPKVVLASPKPADLWMMAQQRAITLAKDMNFPNDAARQDWIRQRANDDFAAAIGTYTSGSATSPNYGGAVPVKPMAPGVAPPVGTGGVPTPQAFPTAPVSQPVPVVAGKSVTGKPLNAAETRAQAGVAAIAGNPEPPATQLMQQSPEALAGALAKLDQQIAAAPAGSAQRANLIAARKDLENYPTGSPVTVATTGQVLTPNNVPNKPVVPGPAAKSAETPMQGVPQNQAPQYNPPEQAELEKASAAETAKRVGGALKDFDTAATAASRQLPITNDLLRLEPDMKSGNLAPIQSKLANLAESVGLKNEWTKEGLTTGMADKIITRLMAERLKEQAGVQTHTDEIRESNAMVNIRDAKDKLLFGLHREKEMQLRALEAGTVTAALQGNVQNPFSGNVGAAWNKYQTEKLGPTFVKGNDGNYMFRHEFIDKTVADTQAKYAAAGKEVPDEAAIKTAAAQAWMKISKGR